VQSQILVEGPDDRHVITNLIAGANGHGWKVIEKGGYPNLISTLETNLKTADRLAIVIDADEDPVRKWSSLRDTLRGLGITVPKVLPPDALIVPIRPVVGVWMMPDNVSPGLIEDFVATMIPRDDVLWLRVQDCVNGVPDTDLRCHRAKARIHTWLAWQPEPGRGMGGAITRRYLNCSAPPATTFLDWLNRLAATAIPD
jgi:hypothetical protein